MKRLAIIFAAIITTLTLVIVTSYIQYHNYGNKSEVVIEKEYENLQNVLSQMTLKVSEIAQVPGMYKDDLKEVLTATMTARMGEGGSKATFQWFKEQNINIDSAMYTKIQQVIESSRMEFQNAQTRFLDVKSVYVKNLGAFWSGFWLTATGYPNINVGYPRNSIDDYPIVKSTAAIDSFTTGVQAPMKLR